MASKYDGLAKIIIQNVGGKSNIISVAHCITRLRFRLKDVSKANTEVLEATDGVIKVLNAGGQYQVVVGQAVTDIYDAVLAAGHLSGVGETDEDGNLIESDAVADDGDKSPIARFVDMISAIIQPALAGLAAAGIMKGVLALCTFMGWMQATDGAYLIWNGFADGFFYFLPVILGYTASKRFKCSEFIGMTLGFALTYPALVAITKADVLGTIFAGTPFSMSYYMTFFGIPVIMPLSGYTSSVIPIIIAVFVASKLEHFFRGFFPENFKFAFVPLCTLVIMAPLTYLVIGPIATLLCDVLQLAFSTLFGIPVVGGLLGGLVLAGVWQVLVVFGLHWSVIAITLINVAALGYDYVLSAYMVCSFAQSMAVLAIILRTKDEKLKSLAWPAFITGFFFGITEPCLYGVTLPRKKPFVISCVASAIGGAIVGFFNTRIYVWGGGAFFGLPGFIDPTGAMGISNMIYVSIGIVVAAVISFVAVYATYRDGDAATKKVTEKAAA